MAGETRIAIRWIRSEIGFDRRQRATLRGLLVGLVTWPRMLPARARILSSRTLSDAELERLLSGDHA